MLPAMAGALPFATADQLMGLVLTGDLGRGALAFDGVGPFTGVAVVGAAGCVGDDNSGAVVVGVGGRGGRSVVVGEGAFTLPVPWLSFPAFFPTVPLDAAAAAFFGAEALCAHVVMPRGCCLSDETVGTGGIDMIEVVIKVRRIGNSTRMCGRDLMRYC